MIALMDFFSGAAKREPSADQRKGADEMHAQYTAYVDAGFSKQQAMQLCIELIRSAVAAQYPKPE